MCRPDNMPTLCNEVEISVEALVMAKTKFSAYDVTKDLRSKVADGTVSIDITETGTVHVGGKDVAKIDHDIIKECVHDIFNSDEMDGYDRSHNGSYFEYHEKEEDEDGDEDDGDDDSTDDAPSTTDGSDYDGSSALGSD